MKQLVTLVFVVTTMTCLGGGMAQSDCTNVLISLSPCLNYIQGNSSTPSSSCCSQLANVVRSSPQCLCQALNGGGSSIGVTVNQTQALALPSACNVQTPSQNRCNGSSSPSGSPPADTTGTPSGSGSKTVPTANGGDSSDADSTKFAITWLLFALVAATFSTM